MQLEELNRLPAEKAGAIFTHCCGAKGWVDRMLEHRPYESLEQLHRVALSMWYEKCSRIDWIEAFRHHPKIGDMDALAEKYAASPAGEEQGQVRTASAETLAQLVESNTAYEQQFGHIFIVCASGKSAEEMLQLISSRLYNHPDNEIRVAMGEQAKITALRLAKQFDHSLVDILGRSQITTHILDTSRGRPANGIGVTLLQRGTEAWSVLAEGVSDADGRIEALLPHGRTVTPGVYKIVFTTGDYFGAQEIGSFYPAIEIQFNITDEAHYHVPLLLNPFGYSTYRGT